MNNKFDVDGSTQNKNGSKAFSNKTGKSSKRRRSGKKQRDQAPTVFYPHTFVGSQADMGKSGNDPAWYNNIPYLKEDAARIPFNVPNGIPQTVGRNINSTFGESGYYAASCYMPGVMTFRIVPVLGGLVNAASDAPNVAAQQIYTNVRKANSGATNYDKTDLMMYILAVDSANMLYEHLVRAYKVATNFNYLNRYQPNVLIQSMGIQPQLITNNLADFRALLDLFAYKLSSLCIPGVFDLLKRHAWMFSNIYKDSENPRANLLQFIPKCLYRWVEGTTDDPNYLQMVEIHDQTWNWRNINDAASFINSLLDPLLGSQDIGVMSGDVAKAYPNKLWQLVVIDEHATINPVFNREVLSEIENMTIFDIRSWNNSSNGTSGQNHVNMTNWNITQSLTNLVTGPYLQQTLTVDFHQPNYGGQCITFNPVVNMHWDNPTSDDVMVATRLTAVQSDIRSNSGEIDVCGTEVCVYADIATMGNYTLRSGTLVPDQSDLDALTYVQVGSMLITSSRQFGGNASDVQSQALMSSFDWHPLMYWYAATQASGGESAQDECALISIIGDLDNYKVINSETLKSIHDAAIMSLYVVKE